MDHSLYRPVEHWGACLNRISRQSFRAKKGEFPDIGKFSHFILTGSEASILKRESWVEEEAALVEEAVNMGKAVLGSCYGHQLLALALQGPDSIGRCREHEIGWYPIAITEESALLGEKREVFSFSIHFDEVVRLDDSFRILAATRKCPIQAFQLSGKPVWGLQIHPEINRNEARKLLRALGERQDRRDNIYAMALDLPYADSGLIHRIMRTFISGDV